MRARVCVFVSKRPKWRNLSAIMLVAEPLRLEMMAYIYAKTTPPPKKANMLQKNIMKTKASSKAERSTGWTGKWPLVLQQTN